MTAPTTQPIAPASPIAGHITVILGGAGALVGITALVLMLCVITVHIPSAPMNFAAVLGATLAGSSCIVWTGQRVIRHQSACYEANREASRAEVAAALKKLHKEWKEERVARVSAAIFEAEQPTRLGVIKGGGNGMG